MNPEYLDNMDIDNQSSVVTQNELQARTDMQRITEIINLIEQDKPDLKFSTKNDSLGTGLKNYPPSLVYIKE